jgi:hypothetical protein
MYISFILRWGFRKPEAKSEAMSKTCLDIKGSMVTKLLSVSSESLMFQNHGVCGNLALIPVVSVAQEWNITPSSIAHWMAKVEAWEQDPSQPNPYEFMIISELELESCILFLLNLSGSSHASLNSSRIGRSRGARFGSWKGLCTG